MFAEVLSQRRTLGLGLALLALLLLAGGAAMRGGGGASTVFPTPTPNQQTDPTDGPEPILTGRTIQLGNFYPTTSVPTPTLVSVTLLPTPTTGAVIPMPSPSGEVEGIWISAEELAQLPMSGAGWEWVKQNAVQSVSPNLNSRDRDQVRVMAKSLIYARCTSSPADSECAGFLNYRQEAANAIDKVIGTEGGDTLAALWGLGGWVISADLIDLNSYDAGLDRRFRDWLLTLLDENNDLGDGSIVGKTKDRPNNWGTGGQFSWGAAAVYLGSEADAAGVGIAEVAKIHKGWLGDRSSYAGFSYGDLAWQCDPSAPVGINPKGCTKNGHSIDGVLPDDQRRAGGFSWPPPKENYVYTGLDGAVPAAVILHRAGYNAFGWEEQALKRAFDWLHNEANYPAEGDDHWLPWIANCYYGTTYPAQIESSLSRTVDFTAWTHAGGCR